MKKIFFIITGLLFGLNTFGQSISSISPSSGNVGSTVNAYIYGSNTSFSSGTNTVSLVKSGSSTIVGTNVYVGGNTYIDCDFAIPGNATPGYYDVVVSNSITGGLTKTSAFQVTNYPKSISTVYPISGNVGEVISNGTIYCDYTNFQVAGSGTVSFVKAGSPTLVGTNTYVDADDHVHFSLSIPSNATPGYYDVVVSNSVDGTLTKTNGFQVTNYPPSIAYVYPSSGNVGEVITYASIDGDYTSFLTGTNTVSFIRSGSPTIVATNVSAYSNTSLDFDLTIPANATPGYYDVIVTNSSSGTLAKLNGFQVTNYPPEIYYVYPSTGNVGETFTYASIDGDYTNFQQAGSNTVAFVKAGSPTFYGTNVVAYSNTSLDFDLTVPNTATPGYYDVVVTNSVNGTLIKVNGFQVTSYPPSIYSVSPNTGQAGKLINNVYISGDYTHFQLASSSNVVYLTKAGSPSILGKDIYVSGNEYISADFTIPKTAPMGLYDVVVSNSIDGTITKVGGFTITAPCSIISMVDSTGNRGQLINGAAITIINNFRYLNQYKSIKAWLVNSSTGGRIDGTSVNAAGNNTLVANFQIPTAAPYGKWDLYVALEDDYYYPTQIDTVIKAGAFRVKNPTLISDQVKNVSDVTFFPNPFNQSAVLSYNLMDQQSVEISLFNVLGERLKVLYNEKQGPGHYELVVPVEEIKVKGIYFLNLKTGNETRMIKILKQ